MMRSYNSSREGSAATAAAQRLPKRCLANSSFILISPSRRLTFMLILHLLCSIACTWSVKKNDIERNKSDFHE